jgi:beta-galactosidase GanA
MLLDYRRFRRDSVTLFTDNMINQLKGALNGGGVKGKITTNAPGGFWDKALDHNDLFSNMDFAGYDNYPVSEPASIEGKILRLLTTTILHLLTHIIYIYIF